jgi:hypothetical protein
MMPVGGVYIATAPESIPVIVTETVLWGRKCHRKLG